MQSVRSNESNHEEGGMTRGRRPSSIQNQSWSLLTGTRGVIAPAPLLLLLFPSLLSSAVSPRASRSWVYCLRIELTNKTEKIMSLRVRTPTDTASISGFRDDEDPPSSSKIRSKREAWSPSMTSMMLLVVLSAVVGIGYTSILSNNTTTSSTNTVVHVNGLIRKQTNDDSNDSHQEKQCTIYMAPSSLKGLDGYGIFTTRDIEKDASIFSEQDGPSIPVIDYKSGPWMKTWNEYLWGRGISDQLRVLGDSVMDLQVGFGSLPNHHCILNSLSHRYPIPDYDDSLVKRGDDPGTGAFSYSMGREFFAQKALKAGDEIFLNYGYCTREKEHKKVRVADPWRGDIVAR